MFIQYLQKMTLLDFPGRVACTLFLHGCNFLCPFCHNPGLVTAPPDDASLCSEEEILSYLQKRKGILDGVAITGGEPLLREEIVPLLEKIKALGYAVKIDTNGTFPDRLERIVGEGLCDYVAMDVKNCEARYAETVGLKKLNFEPIRRSMAFLLSGAVDYEFRTTVVRELHGREDLLAAAEMIRGAKRYFLQKFNDTGDLIGGGFTAYGDEEMRELLSDVRFVLPTAELRGV